MALEKRLRLGAGRRRSQRQHPVDPLDFEFVQVGAGVTTALERGRGAEMVDVMMGAEQYGEIFDSGPGLCKGVLDGGDAVGRIHPGVD